MMNGSVKQQAEVLFHVSELLAAISQRSGKPCAADVVSVLTAAQAFDQWAREEFAPMANETEVRAALDLVTASLDERKRREEAEVERRRNLPPAVGTGAIGCSVPIHFR